jgi:hypothetical protein
MPFTGNPATNAIDRVRLLVGDVFSDFEILDDNTYQYYLDKYEGNEMLAAIAAAKVIKYQIAKFPTRETAGKYEVWSDFAALYTAALDDLIDKGESSLYVGMPYAGGISKQDMQLNNRNRDNVRLCLPRISGCPFNHYLWNNESYDFYVGSEYCEGQWL